MLCFIVVAGSDMMRKIPLFPFVCSFLGEIVALNVSCFLTISTLCISEAAFIRRM